VRGLDETHRFRIHRAYRPPGPGRGPPPRPPDPAFTRRPAPSPRPPSTSPVPGKDPVVTAAHLNPRSCDAVLTTEPQRPTWSEQAEATAGTRDAAARSSSDRLRGRRQYRVLISKRAGMDPATRRRAQAGPGSSPRGLGPSGLAITGRRSLEVKRCGLIQGRCRREVTATPYGVEPTGMVAVILLVGVSIIATSPSPWLTT
jgi:hypothetical protein